MSYQELKELIFNPLESKGLKNYSNVQLSKRGSTVFNSKTILLVGFMLQDSKVVQEVRNQALNIIVTATEKHSQSLLEFVSV